LAVSEEVLRVKGIATCVETDIKALRQEHGASARRSRWSSSLMAERQGVRRSRTGAKWLTPMLLAGFAMTNRSFQGWGV
jgi:hypothetical protein